MADRIREMQRAAFIDWSDPMLLTKGFVPNLSFKSMTSEDRLQKFDLAVSESALGTGSPPKLLMMP